MSLAVVYSRASLGIAAPQVTVEVHLSNGLPAFNMVGLPETSVKSRGIGCAAPCSTTISSSRAKHITVNLALRICPKRGSLRPGHRHRHSRRIQADTRKIPARSRIFRGIGLTGEIRPVQGAPLGARLPRRGRTLLVPRENGPEASLIQGCRGAHRPPAAGGHRLAGGPVRTAAAGTPERGDPADVPDLQDVIGQSQAKRALEIAAAGSHNLLFIGPGTGKSMLASRLPGILPPLSEQEAQQTAAIHSIGGLTPAPATGTTGRIARPSQRLGGGAGGRGTHPRPGEISLPTTGSCFWMNCRSSSARCSIPFANRWRPGTYHQSCRPPGGFSRPLPAGGCHESQPCGHYGDGQTRSSPDQILRYLGKLSGPFLDRFDLTVEVPLLPRGA